jgi:hypothetical protein
VRARIAFLPAAPVLLPEYAGLTDPVAALRAACIDAVTWLAKEAGDAVQVVAPGPDPANTARGVTVSVGSRLADQLTGLAGFDGRVEPADGATPGPAVLVFGNGSARRSEKAPGHLDERAADFDDAALEALARGDAAVLAGLDERLGAELLADGIGGLRRVGRALTGSPVVASTLYADDPFGVQYWVVTWECGS